MPPKTVAQLKTQSNVIRNETAIGGNTKNRVATMIDDMIDSFCLILDITIVSTSGGTIDFDFALKQARKFLGSASFSTAKTITFSASANALEFDFFLNITSGSAILTFQSDVIMTDSRWEVTGSKQWQPNASGWFKGHAELNGTDWLVDISQDVYA